MVGPTSTKPDLAANNRPWTFRNTATSEKIVGPSVDAFLERYPKVKKMAIVADIKDAWSKDASENIFPKFLKAKGIEVVTGTNPITVQTDETDMSAQVTKLKHLDVDAVAVVLLYMDAATFAVEMKRQEVKIPVLCSHALVVPAFIEVTKGAAEGWIGSSTFWPGNPDPKTQDFISRFEKVAKLTTQNAPFPGYADPNIYDAVTITAEIMRSKKITPDTPLDQARELIREGWQNLKNYKGIAGTVSILPNGEGDLQVWPFEVKGGKFVAIMK
jgi:branched-chain amino acid transport system substrate-binding protein